MFDGEQIVKVKWNNTNQEWYENHGYIFTKKNDELYIKAKDLTPASNCKVKAVCDYCGRDYGTPYCNLMNGHKHIIKDACSKCNGKKLSESQWEIRTKRVFNKLREFCCANGYTLITTEKDYSNAHDTVIQYECPKHGIQSVSVTNIMSGHKCFLCSYEHRADGMKISADKIKNIIENDGNTWLNPNDYQGANISNLVIRCSCGNTYTVSYSNYIRHNMKRCSICSQKESVGELKIRQYLESHNIVYEQEKRFNDCKDKRSLPFDFYLPDYNMCIEFDGQHHYTNTFDNNLETVQLHDNIKNQYCIDNGIGLLRIPYWEGNNLNKILSNNIR